MMMVMMMTMQPCMHGRIPSRLPTLQHGLPSPPLPQHTLHIQPLHTADSPLRPAVPSPAQPQGTPAGSTCGAGREGGARRAGGSPGRCGRGVSRLRAHSMLPGRVAGCLNCMGIPQETPAPQWQPTRAPAMREWPRGEPARCADGARRRACCSPLEGRARRAGRTQARAHTNTHVHKVKCAHKHAPVRGGGTPPAGSSRCRVRKRQRARARPSTTRTSSRPTSTPGRRCWYRCTAG